MILEQTKAEIIFTTRKQNSLLQQSSTHTPLDLNVLSLNACDEFYSLKDIPDNHEVLLPSEDIKKTGMIIYTSGSTGKMKGVKISGSQILFQVYSLLRVGFDKDAICGLSMLPMNHMFEISGTISSLAGGLSICVAHGLEKEELALCLQKHNPTQIFSVPLFCKSLLNGIKLNISESSLFKQVIFKILLIVSKVIPVMKFRRLLFKNFHQKLGGKLNRIIVGGAATEISTIKFFELLGLQIYEGYGLTETAPVIAVNRVSKHRAGSVGTVIPGVKVKIDSTTGEILTKGPHLTQGYFNDIESTKKVFKEDGWFNTEDIGHFDKDSFLYVTGRSKNLIILESGKKIHPEEVEKAYDDIEFVSELSVFGSCEIANTNSVDIVLVAYLKEEFMIQNKTQAIALLTNEIQKRSERLAPFKTPTKIVISKDELPKTTTMKVRYFLLREAYSKGEFLS